jgi:DNA-binding transcriptional regulator YiaG
VITGLVRRRLLYDFPLTWHRVPVLTPLRELRRAADLSQQEFAALVDVPLNTFRMWDSGLRPLPPHMLPQAREAVVVHARNAELVSLDQLARELGVHQRTLRAAARTGRLLVTFSSRSVFTSSKPGVHAKRLPPLWRAEPSPDAASTSSG